MRRALHVAPLLLILAAACSGAQDGTTLPPATPCPTVAPSAAAPATPAHETVPPPAALARAEGAVKAVASRDGIPLTGPRVDGKTGDLMIDNGTAVVVVTQEGRIADFGLRDGRDELSWLNPTLSVALNALDAPVLKLAAEGEKALRLERAVAGKPLVLVSFLWLEGATLRVETVAQSTGEDPALAVTLGERLSWGNVPTWMDGHGYIKEAGKLTGGFLARDALGVAYAMCSNEGPLFARFDEPEYSGLFESARTGESVVLVPAHGRSAPRTIALTVSSKSMGDAVAALPCGPKGPRTRLVVPPLPVLRARLEVARCGDGKRADRPFLDHRGVIDAKGPVKSLVLPALELPQGCFRVRLAAPGHAPGPWTEPEKLNGKAPPELLPKAGKLSFAVTESGKPVPARLVVRGEGGTKDPDWGDNADDTGAATNVLATETGSFDAPLPPGKYRVSINRGFEYTASEQVVEIKEGKTAAVKASLTRVVDTSGWVAADLHLHAVPSSDAPSLLSDRVRSLVAGGIEVAIATDHNAVTDYRPVIAELGLRERLFAMSGDEITTRDTPFGHFNAFPVDPKTTPFKYKGTIPAAIFAEVRTAKPFGKETILQVNHPRMGSIGYFEVLRFDPEDIPAWLSRSPLADMGFDAIEVFNGDHYTRIAKVEECLKDWYALLNAGYRVVATGNSDSHRVSFHEPGVPRNLVRLPDGDLTKIDEKAFVDAVRGGRVVVSSGPFVTIRAGDEGVGDTLAAGEAEITVSVDGPAWVDIDEVSIVKRGETVKSWKIGRTQGKRPWQLREKLLLKKDDWVIAIARGKRPMTYLHRAGATPFSFTNPIFVK